MDIELQAARQLRAGKLQRADNRPVQTNAAAPACDPVHAPAPVHANAIEWHYWLGVARQACARIFRDGGNPADALKVFGLAPQPGIDWGRAVERIAEMLSSPAARRAA